MGESKQGTRKCVPVTEHNVLAQHDMVHACFVSTVFNLSCSNFGSREFFFFVWSVDVAVEMASGACFEPTRGCHRCGKSISFTWLCLSCALLSSGAWYFVFIE
ncbi:cytochrome P450 71A10 [Corchorus olitorius]|uniref:Cytochrome P450 71A10 n=1 Tax=Corchorus olitorius TaxID=93759 RepID=A0A1R3KEG9_9ROSI|nr:cytochrome P450 71A10 [Corchorus olitorius]